ncbi:unnamed protein product, partial [Dovyalis caffra]
MMASPHLIKLKREKIVSNRVVSEHLSMNGAYRGLTTLDLLGKLDVVDSNGSCAVQILALFGKLNVLDADKVSNCILTALIADCLLQNYISLEYPGLKAIDPAYALPADVLKREKIVSNRVVSEHLSMNGAYRGLTTLDLLGKLDVVDSNGSWLCVINLVLLPSHADRKYCTKTVEELVESTQMVLRKPSDPVSTLNLIDTIQRLGISHHFEEEIDTQLERFSDWNSREDLFVTALRFRLLRHNGKPANADVFQKFISREGKLIEFLAEDRWGMLSLHEASYLATKNEEMLLQAMNFTRTSLQQLMPFMNSNSRNYVAQALKLPRHLRMARLEARNYINCYSRESNFNPDLFQLASLDFNMVQQQHNTELTEIISYGSLDDLILFTDAIR